MRTVGLGPSVGLLMGPRNVKRCTGRAGRIRTVALGPSVGLPMRPRSAVLDEGNARRRGRGARNA
eukprot:5183995-Pyramimonas_sp.AAC.1